MNDSQVPSRKRAIKILKNNNCPPQVIRHCKAVADVAKDIALKLKKKGISLNLEIVEAGALLHDIGRSKTHSVNHAIEGARIAVLEGLPDSVVKIIERHVGGGISNKEAEDFGWPPGAYSPITIEEKVVTYADKIVDYNKKIPIENTINQLENENLFEAAEKVRKLHEEITQILGE